VRTLVHLADLHFGNEDPALVATLADVVRAVRPDLVAVSGELTQRARRAQFADARRFLDGLGAPWISVPGNHDIPLFNPYRRFVTPVRRFQRLVSDDLAPLYSDGEIAVLGINTARSNVLKEGRISVRQIDLIRRRLIQLAPHVLKIVVVHHPFVAHPDEPHRTMVGRGREFLEVVDECGLDLILAGHTHLGYGDDVRLTYGGVMRSILVFQAGTATARSTRGGESNSFNLITIDGRDLRLDVRAWEGAGFASDLIVDYRRDGHEWRRLGATPLVIRESAVADVGASRAAAASSDPAATRPEPLPGGDPAR
jgi:3',5'-cyclic AMP phosphodiesterase CpdA